MKPENCIFEPNAAPVPTEPTLAEQFFTILGSHDYLDDLNRPRTSVENKNTLAKIVNQKCYIKTGLYGKIYNPMGMFSEGKNEKFIAKIGKKAYEFKQVNQKIFDMYVNFLSTKNLAWLNNAERELI